MTTCRIGFILCILYKLLPTWGVRSTVVGFWWKSSEDPWLEENSARTKRKQISMQTSMSYTQHSCLLFKHTFWLMILLPRIQIPFLRSACPPMPYLFQLQDTTCSTGAAWQHWSLDTGYWCSQLGTPRTSGWRFLSVTGSRNLNWRQYCCLCSLIVTSLWWPVVMVNMGTIVQVLIVEEDVGNQNLQW